MSKENTMVGRVDKSEEFVKGGKTLITEVESDKYLRRNGRRKNVEEGELFDNEEEWADGFCGK
tara:strand:+ start:458 stop:646 length:189 start_codon:yes stop_codon:yes gene_type:complete